MAVPNEVIEFILAQYKWDEDIKQDVIVELLELPDEAVITKELAKLRYASRLSNSRRDEANRRRLLEEHHTKIHMGDGAYFDPLDESIQEEDMRDRLNGLSPLLRDTLEAVVVEGRTPEEVAEAQGVKANVIYQRVHQARQLLQGNNK